MELESVSVVIPAYNAERYLAEALTSVFAQTHPPSEVIVVDDGSTDRTTEVVARFPGVTLSRIQHAGVSVARNLGVEASSGTMVAFLDSDDTWHPRKLELQEQLLRSNPDLGIAMCRHDYAFEGPIPEWFRGPRDGSSPAGCLLTASLIRRAVWDQVGRFEPTMTHGEDGDWLARAIDLKVQVGVVDQPLMTYRIHDANASAMAPEVRNGILRAVRNSLQRKREAASQ